VKVIVKGANGSGEAWSGKALEKAAKGHIDNIYLYNTFGPGLYGIKAKMGAKAWLTLNPKTAAHLPAGHYTVIFQNINGKKFKTTATVS
jgi:hypothetical protein